MPNIRKAHRQPGLTLIELLTSIVILGIVSTMIITVWFALQDSYAYSVNSDSQQATARDAMARMQREIRDAASQPDTSSLARSPKTAADVGKHPQCPFPITLRPDFRVSSKPGKDLLLFFRIW